MDKHKYVKDCCMRVLFSEWRSTPSAPVPSPVLRLVPQRPHGPPPRSAVDQSGAANGNESRHRHTGATDINPRATGLIKK